MTSGHPGKGLEYLRVPLMLAPVAYCCGEPNQPKRELKALLGLPNPSHLLLSSELRPFCRMTSESFVPHSMKPSSLAPVPLVPALRPATSYYTQGPPLL